MLEIRLTVFRDKPSPDLLKAHAPSGYYLFEDSETQTYFLTTGEPGQFAPSPFWAGYDPVLDLPQDFDTSYLKSFTKEHEQYFEDVPLHEELVKDAIALSKAFSTRVLCAYGNDEVCDFAVSAENGRLLRLRFQAGSVKGKRISDAKAKAINSDVKAVRIYPDKANDNYDGVFEYTAYEAIQAEGSPLSLNPFWVYLEGEINRQAILRTIKYEPKDMATNMLFRNAFLEFQEAFGITPPDFTDLADPERFKLIGSKTPPRASKLGLISKLFLSIPKYIIAKPKRILWTAGILLVLAAGIFGDSEDKPTQETEFETQCRKAGGSLITPKSLECRIDNQIYENWNLPGEKGERRIMVLVIAQEKVACTNAPDRDCLSANGTPFDAHIDGFTFTQGKAQIVPVERLQLCDPDTELNCSSLNQTYQFRQIAKLHE